jgi:hypothetical protein
MSTAKSTAADADGDEPMVMTFPHLLVREGIAFLGLTLGLVVVSLAFNAPLEELANPTKTPNPAKAPWYFLGLQELLHYYSPFVSGVLLPTVVVVALAVVPYFRVNVQARPFWTGNRVRRAVWLWVVVAVISEFLAMSGAHPAWPLLVPLWLVAVLVSVSAFRFLGAPGRALRRVSMPSWVFIYFLLVSVTLTVIGVFFRGPGWSFTLPWRDGIY